MIIKYRVFIVKVYLQPWFQVPVSAAAPNRDLILLKKLAKHDKLNHAVTHAAWDKLSRHLDYLTEKLVTLSFFDPSVSAEAEKSMVLALEAKTRLIARITPFF